MDQSKVKLEIILDECPESPREMDCALGIMVCFHSRHSLGDETDLKSSMFDGWAELAEHLEEEEGATHILPLYLMDHSGLSMSTGPFSCGWDSGQVGFIYTTEAKMKEFGVASEDVEACLKAEVKIYSQYLEGDVWGYQIETEDGEVVDSCWGFYGHDVAEEEGRDALSWVEKARVNKRPMTDDERGEYTRTLVQRCRDNHEFLVQVVEGFIKHATYEDYLAACGSADGPYA